MRFMNRKKKIRLFGDIKRFYTGRATPREVVETSANVQFFRALGFKKLAKKQAIGTLKIYRGERRLIRGIKKRLKK